MYLLSLLGGAIFCNRLPGLKLRLTQVGANYVANKGLDVLSSQVEGATIPDQHDSAKVKVGKVNYDLTEMHVTTFIQPRTSVAIQPATGITWTISGGSLGVHGNWHYKYKWHFVKKSDHGSFDITASDLQFSLSFILGSDTSGQPTIHTTGCTGNVNHVKVKFHGGASWLYNLFDSKIAKAVKHSLNQMLCTAAEKAININGAKELATLDLMADLDGIMDLDYTLTKPPEFGMGYVDSFHKGEVYWHESHTEAPFSPSVMPPMNETSKMFYMWMSDYTFNTFTYVTHQHDRLSFNLSKDNLPLEDQGKLNTTCHGTLECLGLLIPQAGKVYPDATFVIHIRTLAAPVVAIQPDSIQLSVDANVTYYAELHDGSQKYLFTTNTTVKAAAVVAVKNDVGSNHKLTYKVTNLQPVIKVAHSAIGPISSDALTWGFDLASKAALVKINAEGARGIDIPSFEDVNLINTQLVLQGHCLMIGTDLQYQPSTLFYVPSKV